MDIEKLIEQLRDAGWTNPGLTDKQSIEWDAADALSTLQTENEKLRAERVELEQMAACVYYKQGGLCRYGEEDPANFCVFGPCPHQRSAQEVLAELEQVKRERDEAVHDRMMMEKHIGKINAKKEKAERERDAAISDLETIMAYGEADLDTCEFCKNGQCYARGGTKPCLPKWRGQKEE